MPSPPLLRRLNGGVFRQLLEDPGLAPALRALPPPALRQVILRVGLEDAGELIALASLEQLREVFDEDLWRSDAPGQDEAFDATRFIVWLEVLLEGGETEVADRLAQLSEEFLVLALSRLLWVLDVSVLTTWASSDPAEAERLDRILDAESHHELDDTLLLFRARWGWDAVLSTILALDQNHPQLLREILSRCAIATHEELQSAHMLHTALAGEELLLEDARAERELRRAERGFVSPADARAFLALARTAPEQPAADPITRAHFRELGPQTDRVSPGSEPSAGLPPHTPLRRLLLDAGGQPDTAAVQVAANSLLRQSLHDLFEHDPEAHQRVVEELAYLSNVLIAGDTSRAWRPGEAAECVLELCDEGLRSIAGGEGEGRSTAREEAGALGRGGCFPVCLGFAQRIRLTGRG